MSGDGSESPGGDGGEFARRARAVEARAAEKKPVKRKPRKPKAAPAEDAPARPRKARKKPAASGSPAGEAPAGNRRGVVSRVLRAVLRRVVKTVAWAVAGVLLLVLAYRVVPVPGGAYMLTEWWRLGQIERQWRGMDAISPHLARAVVAAEDARFCAHGGIDWQAVQDAVEDWQERGRLRGGSTITQQTAKNVFLWHGRTMTRKGLEAVFAGLIELMWDKRRILEVYLNVAEFGEGVFGAEAAARHHFGVPASELMPAQSARLAAVLPNPKARDPNRLSGGLRTRASRIQQGAETIRARGDDACFLR